ncbi:hypothetical protein ANCDUO_06227 [Ancylostoma duodenale]|uniref:Anoctamin n=1 Tax=Ancylostoma duodenale TaxID=51022 RepID=A0A0C2GWN3_9BILA|nr:hypothetical protein ANCDUO_06227 [Ancylostoma duodenale]
MRRCSNRFSSWETGWHHVRAYKSMKLLFSDICFVLFAFFNCVWSTAYLESWKRKQAELAFKWGTYDTNCDSYLQDPRPQFRVWLHGVVEVYYRGVQLYQSIQGEYFAPNPVSGRVEPYYPPWKHAIVRYGKSLQLLDQDGRAYNGHLSQV